MLQLAAYYWLFASCFLVKKFDNYLGLMYWFGELFLLNIQIHFTALTEMKFDTRTFSSHCTYQLLFIGFQQLHTNLYLVLQFVRVCLLNARRSAFSLSKRLSQILPSMRGLGSLKA